MMLCTSFLSDMTTHGLMISTLYQLPLFNTINLKKTPTLLQSQVDVRHTRYLYLSRPPPCLQRTMENKSECYTNLLQQTN